MDEAKILLGSLGAALGAYAAFKVSRAIYRNETSTLKDLPGPQSHSLLYGNSKELWASPGSYIHEKWVEQHGPTITYREIFGLRQFYTTDLKALHHIITNDWVYQKPEPFSYFVRSLMGEGLLVTEEDAHKNQRRIMNPAFANTQIRELTNIFFEKSIELREALIDEVSKQTDSGTVNVVDWLSRTTLDIIGLSGFGYQFNALSEGEDSSELNKALAKIFERLTNQSLRTLLPAVFPALRVLNLDESKEAIAAKATMKRIGAEILHNSREELKRNGMLDKDSLRAKDLLTLLLRANMATDLPPHQRMSDEDVISQIPTFLVAGHETTSMATTWALYALANDSKIQRQLRDELLTVSTDSPSMDELNALPYLDKFVREVLRLHAPVTTVWRVAVKDDVIPLATPIVDKKGRVLESVAIQKGQGILVPLLHLNRQKDIWGDDVLVFRPERWETVPKAASLIPGVWSNMLSFLGGQRSCIGYRFSIVEIKAIVFTLIRAFEFELAVPVTDIGVKPGMVQRPYLRSRPEAGFQLPLRLRLYGTGQ